MAAIMKETSSIMDYVSGFEQSLDYPHLLQMMGKHWTVSLWISLVYVALIFAGQRYMKSRPAYDLRTTLGIWSAFLAVFSIAGAYKLLPELYDSWVNHSFENSLCNHSYMFEPPGAFWAFAFTLSKTVELFDTAFLVLRKKPVIFLHWYHHASVMVYCFLAYGSLIGSGRYFMTINYVVHSIMYTYYAMKSFNIWIPRKVSMLITFLQLIQMAVGIFINIKSYFHLNAGVKCSISYSLIFWTFIMYASYLILFANFFYNTYLRPKSKSKKT